MLCKTFAPVRRVALSGLTLTGILIATASAQEEQIAGTWNCSTAFEDAELGISMTAEFESTYGADGMLERDGGMNMTIAALGSEISFMVKAVGTWKAAESMVIEETISSTEFAAGSEEPSQIEQMMLQQMQAQVDGAGPQTDTIQLESLTDTTMVGANTTGAAVTCQKV